MSSSEIQESEMQELTTLALSASVRGAAAPAQPISRLMAEALANPDLISLAAGFVDTATLPTDAVGEIVSGLMSDRTLGQAALQYGENTGDRELRRLIAERSFGGAFPQAADAMVLSAGSNQLLHLVSECMLNPGDVVLCAAPTYFVYLGILNDIDARSFGISTDRHGMNPAQLEATLEHFEAIGQLDRVKMLYLVPYFDNPAGTNMPAHRRSAILDVLTRWKDRTSIALVADNAYRDLRYGDLDEPSFLELGAAPERTIETGTFSKNFSPGIRVGWGVLPEPLYSVVCRRKAIIDFGSAHFSQCIVREAILRGDLDRHLSELRKTYGAKAKAMVAACEEYLRPNDGVEFAAPTGGLYVWLRLPHGLQTGPDTAFWNAAVRRGVLYVPGEFCFAAEGASVEHNCLRLSFGVQTPEKIHEGIRLLAEAVEDVLAVSPS